MARLRRSRERRTGEQYIYSKHVLFRIRLAVLVPFEVDQNASPTCLAELMCLLFVAEIVFRHVVVAYWCQHDLLSWVIKYNVTSRRQVGEH